jgi:predicted Fe-Mo cluster-binding NifX family protein
MVDARFGRCGHFVVVDTETGECRAVNNGINLNSAQGAGIQSARNISTQGVAAVITGHCGPKAFRVLRAAGIKVYPGGGGSVGDAVAKFKQGLLEEAQTADVEGHWS